LSPRDPAEPHRSATPLELFFDLCFVVAIAAAASKLHHGIGEGHIVESIQAYTLAFFAIWWAWVNFTWFSSAYDNDDVPFRLLVFVQMIGVLVLAAGIPRAFDRIDYGFVTLGYSIMRVGLVAQWLRAARRDEPRRRTAHRYALGITLCQIGWITLFFSASGERWMLGWVVLASLELAVPAWAERVAATPWHAGHIAERYGLLTLIVLGESVLASTSALQSAIDGGTSAATLAPTIVGGLLVLFSMWWVYFAEPVHRLLTSSRVAFEWGYAHYFVFGCAAAVGAGLAAYTDAVTGHGHVSTTVAGASVAWPAGVFVLLVWWLHCRRVQLGLTADVAYFVATALLFVSPFTPWPVPAAGVTLGSLVAIRVAADARRRTNHREPATRAA
jgi:low temperature requirement protein LtrA